MKNFLNIECSYDILKSIQISRNLFYRFVETSENLIIFCVDIPTDVVYQTYLFKNGIANRDDASSITDFESNIRPVAAEDNSIEDGVALVFSQSYWPETSSKNTLLVTPLVHRKNLIYKPIGLEFTLNTDEDGTYNKKTRTMQLTQASGPDYVYLDTIKWVAPFLQITISEGQNSETKTIYTVDTSTKKISFTSVLTNSYTTAAIVTINLIDVTVNGSTTSVDYYVTENHGDTNYQGIDIEAVKIQGDFRNDRLNVYAWHAYYGPNVNMGDFLEDIPLPSGLWEQHLEAVTTTSITPGLVIRLKFECNSPEERFIGVIGEVWRQ